MDFLGVEVYLSPVLDPRLGKYRVICFIRFHSEKPLDEPFQFKIGDDAFDTFEEAGAWAKVFGHQWMKQMNAKMTRLDENE